TIQTDPLNTGFTPGTGWGLGWCVVREPQGVTAMLSPGSFGHGGAYGTQAWIDPGKKRVYLLMVQRANFPNSDASEVRRGFQEAASAALDQQPARSAGANGHVLMPTPQTVVWGYFDGASKPVLKVKSGETVEVRTLLAGTPEVLRRGLLPDEEVEQALRDVVNHVKDKGPGGHILTGPIYIEGAEPGDTLEVRLREIKLALPYGYAGFVPK